MAKASVADIMIDRGASPMSNRAPGNRIAARASVERRELPKMCRRAAHLGRGAKARGLSPI